MTSEKYNDGVLDLKFTHLEKSVEAVKVDTIEHMDTQFEAKMAVINDIAKDVSETRTQTQKTNGHVADAFREIESLKASRVGFTYAMAVAMVVIVPILGLSLYKIWSTPPALSEKQIQAAAYAGVIQAATKK